MATGDIITVWNDTKAKVLEASGLTVPSGAMSDGTAATYSVDADAEGYPDALFILKISFGTLPVENSTIALCVQDLDLDGTDGDIPETTRPNSIGTFSVNNTLSLQALKLLVQDVPRKAKYFLYNVNTGQAIGAGWTLKVIPKTYRPAA